MTRREYLLKILASYHRPSSKRLHKELDGKYIFELLTTEVLEEIKNEFSFEKDSIMLYRGILIKENEEKKFFNHNQSLSYFKLLAGSIAIQNSDEISSWTTSLHIAKHFAKIEENENFHNPLIKGLILKKEFSSKEILLDFELFSSEIYDYCDPNEELWSEHEVIVMPGEYEVEILEVIE